MIETNIVYVLNRGHRQGILFPDENGVPTFPEQAPLATLAAYVSVERAEQNDFDAAHKDINQGGMLLVFQESPDGAPRRCARCFTLKDVIQNAPWQDRTQHHSGTLHRYQVTTILGHWSWLDDHHKDSHGYFLTGVSAANTLWRIERIESDVLHRAVFTLAPVRLIGGLAAANFAVIKDELTRGELEDQYADFARSIEQHAFRDVVTRARNIVEAIIAYKLNLLDSTDRLYDGLKRIEKMLNDTTQRDTCGWTDIQYHIAHKIRLLHGRTHATTRASLPPELALSTVEDLNFLLREWGFAK